MRYQRFKRFAIIFLELLGFVAITLALFAYPLGLAKTTTFGRKHLGLVILGCLCLMLALLWSYWAQIRKSHTYSSVSNNVGKGIGWFHSFTAHRWFFEGERKSRQSNLNAWLIRNPWIWVVTASLVVILIYFFIITGGKWVLYSSSGYYDRLAAAFLKGSLSLLDKPPAALQALPDPYHGNRAGISYLWDTSYFQGKYYLYWGPTPALIAAAASIFQKAPLGNPKLVFSFLMVMTLTLAGIFHFLRARYFPETPAWTAGFLTLAAMLSLPAMWLVNHPGIYESAISGAQVFLILGVFAALKGMVSKRNIGWQVLAGFSWGAAVGSRATNLFVIAWMALILVGYFYKTSPRNRWFINSLGFIIPLLLWGIGLGWYNYARFGSVIETGYRYQLTNQGAWAPNFDHLFSTTFIFPNFYNYFIRPLELKTSQFPFFIAPFIDDPNWPPFFKLAEGFLSREPIAGVLYSTPLIWLLLLPVLKPIEKAYRWIYEKPGQYQEVRGNLRWIWWLITGAVIVSILTVISFFFSTMRYIADFYTLLIILQAMCIWWGLDFLKNSPFWRRGLLVVVITLGLIGMIIGLLACMNDPYDRLKSINPELFSSMANFFQSFIH